MCRMPFTNHDEYPISPLSMTTSSTDNQHADAQSELNPACQLFSLATLTPSNCDFTKN